MTNERIKKVKKILNDSNINPLLIIDIINNVKISGYGIFKDNKAKINSNRYYLYIDLENSYSRKILTVIMLNPSNTFPEKGFDSSVKNAIRIARCAKINGEEAKFSAVEVLNLFSFINGNENKSRENYNHNKQENDLNKKFILDFLQSDLNNFVLIAWGGTAKQYDKEYLNLVKNNLKNTTYAFHFNKDGKTPTHLAQRVENRFKYIEKFCKNPELITIN